MTRPYPSPDQMVKGQVSVGAFPHDLALASSGEEEISVHHPDLRQASAALPSSLERPSGGHVSFSSSRIALSRSL